MLGPLPLGLISLPCSYLVCSHFEQQGLWEDREDTIDGPWNKSQNEGSFSVSHLPGFIIPSIPTDLHISFIGRTGLGDPLPTMI